MHVSSTQRPPDNGEKARATASDVQVGVKWPIALATRRACVERPSAAHLSFESVNSPKFASASTRLSLHRRLGTYRHYGHLAYLLPVASRGRATPIQTMSALDDPGRHKNLNAKSNQPRLFRRVISKFFYHVAPLTASGAHLGVGLGRPVTGSSATHPPGKL